MTFTAIPLKNNGYGISAAELNLYLRDNLLDLKAHLDRRYGVHGLPDNRNLRIQASSVPGQHVEWGWTGEIGPGNYPNYDFTFVHPYSAIPAVIPSSRYIRTDGEGESGGYQRIQDLVVKGISTTGVQIRARNTSGDSVVIFQVCWLAIGTTS
jgi:hypothetical protein